MLQNSNQGASMRHFGYSDLEKCLLCRGAARENEYIYGANIMYL